MLPANFAAELTITVINLDSEKTDWEEEIAA